LAVPPRSRTGRELEPSELIPPSSWGGSSLAEQADQIHMEH
jgi:hypothetical protein